MIKLPIQCAELSGFKHSKGEFYLIDLRHKWNNQVPQAPPSLKGQQRIAPVWLVAATTFENWVCIVIWPKSSCCVPVCLTWSFNRQELAERKPKGLHSVFLCIFRAQFGSICTSKLLQKSKFIWSSLHIYLKNSFIH